jgi:hypothetical protein
MAAELAGRGVAVVGWDIPSYLGVARTLDGAAADLRRLLEHYLDGRHKDRVILVGYSHREAARGIEQAIVTRGLHLPSLGTTPGSPPLMSAPTFLPRTGERRSSPERGSREVQSPASAS